MQATNKTPSNPSHFTHTLWIILSLTCLLALYFKYCIAQYTDVFLEAQFLHVNFLKDTVNGVFNIKDFFTTYGEHLFPGYNILLFLNYKLLQVRASFDLLISYLSLAGTAALILAVAKKENLNGLLTSLLFLIVLSPVQNPLWSMALAAQVSTFMLVAIVYLVYYGNDRYKLLALNTIIPIYVIFFAGAYAFSFVGAIFSICLFANFRQDKKLLVSLITISGLSFIIYYLIITQVSPTLSRAMNGYHYNIVEIIRFADLMLGSSLLGKAFFEKFNLLWIYYAAGMLVFAVLTTTVLFNFRNLKQRSDYFFLALLGYVSFAILMVSVTRNINGAEGALGQWYQSHLKFIPLACIYFLFRMNTTSTKGNTLRAVSMGLLLMGVLAGYYYEYIKAPYAKDWKADKGHSALPHLINPKQFLASTSDPLLWQPAMVNDGIEFFYRNNLSYFRLKKFPFVNNLTDDKWVEKNKYLTILCPYHSKSVTIQFDSINKSNLSLIPHVILSTDRSLVTILTP